ncbi:MAG TPA: T9SS type A sorting domain-containing protein [Candidatus Marinimicrobia bacterium]|nr:T9SS type A sorting domain-containing protein [Candidatus Neomarinimicrobiota bacterium]
MDGYALIGKGFVGRDATYPKFSGNFFDSEASNQSTAINATGKTTNGMKTLATFTGASWDIVSGYDTNHIWNLESGVNSGYPYLSWAKAVDQSLPVTLASFTGKATKAGMVLEWETSAEIENFGFVIYRREENSPQPPLRGGVKSESDYSTNSPSLEGTRGVLLALYITDNALVGQGSVTKSTKYSFTDTKVEAGKSYVYTLSDVDFSGKETKLAEAKIKIKVEAEGAILADNYILRPVYPNPFNASFTVPFSLTKAMNVKISLYNIAGQRVMTILENNLNAGEYSYQVNADNLGSGVYFVNVEIGSSTYFRHHTQKIVLMK